MGRLYFVAFAEGCNDLDGSNDVGVERRKIFGWNPVFEGCSAADFLHLIRSKERGANVEAKVVTDVPGEFILCIPLARDKARILLVQNRIKNRVPIEARREGTKVTVGDEIELALAHGTVKSDGGFFLHAYQ